MGIYDRDYVREETRKHGIAGFVGGIFRRLAALFSPRRPSRAEIDRILDKINAEGMESLTDREREVLKRASR